MPLDHQVDRLVGRIELGQLERRAAERGPVPDDDVGLRVALGEVVGIGEHRVVRRGRVGGLPDHEPGLRLGVLRALRQRSPRWTGSRR